MSESRYDRQIRFAPIGDEGQGRIAKARVAIIGVGALGCTIADQLARAGVGMIRLVDPDIPEISNLQRHSLIDERDVERRTPKALAAAARLRKANSSIAVETRVARLGRANASKLLRGVDLVLDGSDNFEARYLVNEICVRLGLPFVFGGVLGAAGMSFSVLPQGPCLRCALGPQPKKKDVPTTADRGVLSPAVATVASLEVVAALRIIVGAPPEPRLAVFDLWEGSFRCLAIERDPRCPVCAPS